jgi:hypothetical protein
MGQILRRVQDLEEYTIGPGHSRVLEVGKTPIIIYFLFNFWFLGQADGYRSQKTWLPGPE